MDWSGKWHGSKYENGWILGIYLDVLLPPPHQWSDVTVDRERVWQRWYNKKVTVQCLGKFQANWIWRGNPLIGIWIQAHCWFLGSQAKFLGRSQLCPLIRRGPFRATLCVAPRRLWLGSAAFGCRASVTTSNRLLFKYLSVSNYSQWKLLVSNREMDLALHFEEWNNCLVFILPIIL